MAEYLWVAGQWGMDMFSISIRHQAETLNLFTTPSIAYEHATRHYIQICVNSEAFTMLSYYSFNSLSLVICVSFLMKC